MYNDDDDDDDEASKAAATSQNNIILDENVGGFWVSRAVVTIRHEYAITK